MCADLLSFEYISGNGIASTYGIATFSFWKPSTVAVPVYMTTSKVEILHVPIPSPIFVAYFLFF